MRVATTIHTLAGARRHALYDDRSKVCHPIDAHQYRALHAFARGGTVRAQDLGLPSGAYWRLVSEMRARGWLEAGAPVRRELELHGESDWQLPDRFHQVWFELTNACNLQCGHCYADSGPKADRRHEMSDAEWLDVADEVLDHGVRAITFIGGEPTIRMDLIQRLTAHVRLRSPDTLLGIFSNLAHFPRTDEIVAFLRSNGLRIGTSLYGADAETHDRMTRKPGSWAQTTESIQFLLARGVHVFAGMYVDMSSSSPAEEERYRQWARSLGLSDFDVLAPSRVGRGEALDWKPPKRENTLPGVKHYGYSSLDRTTRYHNCFHDRISITPEGKVIACIMTRDAVLGDLRTGSIIDVLAGAAYREVATLSKDKVEGCRDCEYRYGCFDCRPDARGATGNLLAKPDCGYDPHEPLGAPLDSAPQGQEAAPEDRRRLPVVT